MFAKAMMSATTGRTMRTGKTTNWTKRTPGVVRSEGDVSGAELDTGSIES
jgi:hypothetical protein